MGEKFPGSFLMGKAEKNQAIVAKQKCKKMGEKFPGSFVWGEQREASNNC